MHPEKKHLTGSMKIGIIILVTAVISVALYLTNKAEHTMLYKINNNVHTKTSKIIIM